MWCPEAKQRRKEKINKEKKRKEIITEVEEALGVAADRCRRAVFHRVRLCLHTTIPPQPLQVLWSTPLEQEQAKSLPFPPPFSLGRCALFYGGVPRCVRTNARDRELSTSDANQSINHSSIAKISPSPRSLPPLSAPKYLGNKLGIPS